MNGTQENDKNSFTINQERYLELEIKDRVDAEIKKYVEDKKELAISIAKLLLPVGALLVTIIIGGVTYWQITSFQELADKTKEAKEEADKIKALTAKAESNLATSSQLVSSASGSIKQSYDLMATVAKNTTDSTRNILDAQQNLIDAQGKLADIQAKLKTDIAVQVGEVAAKKAEADLIKQQIERINTDLNNVYSDSKVKLREVNERLQDLKDKTTNVDLQVTTINAQATKVSEVNRRIFSEEGDLQQVKDLTNAVIKLKASELLFLHQRTTSETITLPNIDLTTGKVIKGDYLRFEFQVGDIGKEQTPLFYRVTDNKGNLIQSKQITLGGEKNQRQVIPILETPYFLILEFIARIGGDDFLALRVQAQAQIR